VSYLRGIFVLGLVLSILISPVVFAAEDNPGEEVKLPSADLRGRNEDAVIYTATINSRDGHILVFFGNDEAAFHAVQTALRQAMTEGMHIKALIHASPRPTKTFGKHRVGTANEIMFFAAQRQIGTMTNAQKNVSALSDEVLRIVRENQGDYVREGA